MLETIIACLVLTTIATAVALRVVPKDDEEFNDELFCNCLNGKGYY